MATDRYDLHTVDYSVQGWDTIMTTDMEQLDDVIASRVIGTLGETVAAYKTVYLKSDGKYYKTVADSNNYHIMGLTIEGGILDDEIRIQKIGEITDSSWTWTVGAKLYNDISTAGEMTETRPAEFAQVLGIALTATTVMLTCMGNDGSAKYGEMYTYNSTTDIIISTADKWHAVMIDVTEGETNGFTYQAGVSGTDITAYATYDSGNSTLVTTTAAHNLADGDFITIVGTTNYNDIYEVLSAPSSTTFEIDKAWDTNDDATGSYYRGSCLTVDTGASGKFRGSWNATGISAVNAHIFEFAPVKNKTPATKAVARRKFSNADYGVMGGGAIMDINVGDKIWFATKNIGATGNVQLLYRNMILTRL
jgi:hypothetical protein